MESESYQSVMVPGKSWILNEKESGIHDDACNAHLIYTPNKGREHLYNKTQISTSPCPPLVISTSNSLGGLPIIDTCVDDVHVLSFSTSSYLVPRQRGVVNTQ